MISRAEYGHTALGREAHNRAVLYVYKLDNPRDTRELVNKLAEAVENPEEHNIREIMEDAQAEIDFLPDNQIGLMQIINLATAMIPSCPSRWSGLWFCIMQD